MGGCISSNVISNRTPSRPKQRPNVRFAGPDLSSMDLDQLLRTGIAEAQLATVARVKRDRSLHLHRARAVFTEALRKNGARDPDLREHLLDVLRRLGENARDIVRIGAASSLRQRSHSHMTYAQSSTSASSMMSDDHVASRNLHLSEHSSEEAPTQPKDYVVMNDVSPTERCESEAHIASQGMDNDEIMSSNVSLAGETWDNSSLLNKSTPLGSSDSSLSPRDPISSEVLLPAVRERIHEDTPTGNAGNEAYVTNKHSPGAASDQNLADEKSAAILETSQTSSHARARLAHTHKSWASVDGNNVVGDSRESFGRVRALQPLQASSSQIIKRRQAESTGSLLDVGGILDAKLDLERRVPHLLPRHPRHPRRQPSQSSSSSQGTVSDSDGSAMTKRSCMSKANTLRGELAEFMKLERSSQKFEPPDRNRTYDADSAHGDVSCSKHSPCTSSYAASSEAPSVSCDVKTISDSLTPALEKAASLESRSDHMLEKATPCLESNVQNPLSQVLGCERLLSKAGSLSANASPQESAKTSRSSRSSISWPPIGLSPFCEGAKAGSETRSPLGSIVVPSSSDKLSVRILNGVSGEEEVRFPVPLQDSFSEQHFYSLLDRLCQKHAGQTLSDLNWLDQAGPNARYQRRKCSTNMLEEIFCQDEPSKRTGPLVLLLCTVPAKPPSEMPANSVRLKNLRPDLICYGAALPVQLRLDTSLLEDGHQYSVAFTHQWTHATYTAEASVFPTRRGVELSVPWQMLKEAGSSTEGLYDVHVVTDFSYRSENRRTLTIGSAESEFSSSSAALSTAQSSFVPLR